MYLLSPLYIKWAYKNPSKTFAATLGAIVVSIAMQLSVFYWGGFECSSTIASVFYEEC